MPPGTRTSLYENPEYQKAAPFAEMTLDSINAADPTNPTVKPVPYTGVQFVAIPEFQGIGTDVGQHLLGGARRPDRPSTTRWRRRRPSPTREMKQGRLHQVSSLPAPRARPAMPRRAASSRPRHLLVRGGCRARAIDEPDATDRAAELRPTSERRRPRRTREGGTMATSRQRLRAMLVRRRSSCCSSG